MEEKDLIVSLLKDSEPYAAREIQFEHYKKEIEKKRGKSLTPKQCEQFRVWFEEIVASPIKE